MKSAGTKAEKFREEQLGDSPIIVRQKVHETVPMSVDEALNQMDWWGTLSSLFVDEETTNSPARSTIATGDSMVFCV